MSEALAKELRAIRRGGRFGVPARAREVTMLVSRYFSVGLLNTAISLGIIMGLDRGLHADPQLANLAGYAVGIMSGFVLSQHFVFRSFSSSRSTGPKYFVTVICGFCLNQSALFEARHLLAGLPFDHLIAQLCGMASYTFSVFFACRFWVFKTPIDPGDRDGLRYEEDSPCRYRQQRIIKPNKYAMLGTRPVRNLH